jgi:hypothetical protein
MKRNSRLILLASIIIISALGWNYTPRATTQSRQKGEGGAIIKAESKRLENYDIRDDQAQESRTALESYRRTLGARQAANVEQQRKASANAKAALAASVPALRVSLNKTLNTTEIVGIEGHERFLTAPSSEKRETITRNFIAQNAALYGLSATQATQLTKFTDYTNPAGNLSFVGFKQEINGIPVFQGEIQLALTERGEIARTTGLLAPALDYATLSTKAKLSAPEAASAAAQAIGVKADAATFSVKSISGSDSSNSNNNSNSDNHTTLLERGTFTEDIKARLVYFQLAPGVATLAYSMTLWEDVAAYYILVDANTGRLLWRKNIVSEQTQSAIYSVYNNDSPAPLSPSNATPGSGIQGAPISRTTFNIVSELPGFDNLGWIPDGINTTTGNNVDAGLDIESPDDIDANGRAVGTPFRTFNFAYNPPPGGTDAPSGTNFRMGAVTNIFFWSNRYHDRLYQLGFTEAARNFQDDNFGRGGVGNDHVSAEAQDYLGHNNASFGTPADGTPPRMTMYLYNGSTPDRDSDLDADVFLHELTHGTSNRLHADGSGLTGAEALGMGEGWSDFYARALLSSSDEDVNGVYPMSAYTARDFLSEFTGDSLSTDNSYYGIRRFPYAVKSNVGANGRPHNPLTFADTSYAQIDLSDGAYPPSPLWDIVPAGEAHSLGEIWCMMLLEVRARLINRLGYAAGNQRALQLVTDAMKLDPVDPTFFDGRDSLIAADNASFGGADVNDIWDGFAVRGMGFNSSYSFQTGIIESFTRPNLLVSFASFSDATTGNNNGVADPGETLIITLSLVNHLTTTANNATVTTTGGFTANYGNIPAGTTATRTFNYIVPGNALCGSLHKIPFNINSSFGPVGPVTPGLDVELGQPIISDIENFDGVSAPALPAGWTTSHTGGVPDWVTSTTNPNTLLNDAYVPVSDILGITELVSPDIPVNIPRAQLSFKNLYLTDDGMVLEISIPGVKGGAFQDILRAGGSFVSGRYNSAFKYDDPLPNRLAWRGISGGTVDTPTYVDTVINLPETAFGQSIKLKFRYACDDDHEYDLPPTAGVRIDSLRIINGFHCDPVASTCALNTPSNLTSNSDLGQCGAVVSFPTPAFTGNCATVTTSPAAGSFFPIGINTITVTGTPPSGAPVTKTFTITVSDTQAPTIACPSDITAFVDANQLSATVNFPAPSASDNCAGVNVTSQPASGSSFPVGTTLVASTATDAHGKTSTCTFNVTVRSPLIISEFRNSGPVGAQDQFIELANTTSNPITVSTTDGSDGWAVVTKAPGGAQIVAFKIPNGTIIPVNGHFLAATNPFLNGYSLGNYAAHDAISPEFQANYGFALFRTSNAANFTLANRLDAVGFASNGNTLFRKGVGLPSVNAGSEQWSMIRKIRNAVTGGNGTIQDSDDNATDFILVSTIGTVGGVNCTLGSPGPQGLTSPRINDNIVPALLDPTAALTLAPNRERNGSGNSGTLAFRRTFTNNTGANVTRLRFRIIDITTLNSPPLVVPPQAILKGKDSADQTINTGIGSILVRGVTLESPSAAGNGGLNSSFAAGTITPANPLLPTDNPATPNVFENQISVTFLMDVVQNGRFRFFVNIEELP